MNSNMIMIKVQEIRNIEIKTWLNYSFIALAFFIPISKAGVSFFETLILILWFIEGNWKYKFSLYIKNPVIVTLFLFLLYSTISLLWAKDLLFGLDYIGKYKHFLIIPIIYSSLNKKYVGHIFSAFLLSMLLSEVVSYGIFFEIWSYKNVQTTFPTPFMGHIPYSVYLSFAAMILLNKIFFEENKKYQLYYILFFISVTANLFINGGRTGQLTFIVMLFILFILNMKQKLKALLFSITLVALVLTLAFTFSPNVQERVHQGQTDIYKMQKEKDYEGSLSSRIGLWIIGVDQITEKFDFGTGIGSDMDEIVYYAEKNDIDYKFEIFTDHHNMFITYAIQLGEPVLFIVILLFYFIFTLHIENKMYQNLNILFIVSFTLWGWTGMIFHVMDSMTLFALFVGLFNSLASQKNKNKLHAKLD